MKLIQRKVLLCQDRGTDQVYEIDLNQISESRYVINFRHGRRGTTLNEGTKTAAAVATLDQAQRVFDRLVAEKLRSGYRDVAAQGIHDAPQAVEEVLPVPSVPQPQVPVPPMPRSDDAQEQKILSYLHSELSGLAVQGSRKPWKIDRVIWRAGELGLRSAAPLLLQLIERSPISSLQQYCLAWALGLCGDERAVPTLEQIYRQETTPEHVRRISLEAIFKLSPAQQVELRQELIGQLPHQFQDLVRGDDTQLLLTLTEACLAEGGEQPVVANNYTRRNPSQLPRALGNSSQPFTLLDQFYQIDTVTTRAVLLELLKKVPFTPPYFKRVRHIFKMAEYRGDGEVFALLARRFEREPAMYNSDRRDICVGYNQYLSLREYRYDPQTREYKSFIHPDLIQEQQSDLARIAYSSKTRAYLLRRVWRSLSRLGEQASLAYVPMATSLLLQYTDADVAPLKMSVIHRWDRDTWRRIETHRIHWDQFAAFLTFNHILYDNSPRYELKPKSKAWRCKNAYQPGQPAPNIREEAFTHLWEQQPEALLGLLLESECTPVHEFAAKALRSCAEFCQNLDLNVVLQLLSRSYEVTAQLGFELAQQQYQPTNPNLDLVLAIANCTYTPARVQAHQWILDQRDHFLLNSPFMAGLVVSRQGDTRHFARELLNTAILDGMAARSLIGRILATLLTLDATQGDLVDDVAQTVQVSFSVQLRSLGLEVILDLLRHPMPELQALGAQILLNHETPVINLPAGLIDALLASPYEAVRVIGVRLFGQLPDEQLLQKSQLVITLATHVVPGLREAIRPGIRRLAANHPEFGQQLVACLLQILRSPEPHEGVHHFIAQVLNQDIPGWMNQATQIEIWDLLQIQSSAAQEVAGMVIQNRAAEWAETVEVSAIARLTHHEVLAVRQSGYQMLRQSLPRLRQSAVELTHAVLIFDSRWADAREFGFELFGTLLKPEDFTPAVVISICDCVAPEVRKFGRDLLGKCFDGRDGQEYLVKFSEHPAHDMQLFASHYLESYASSNPDRLQELQPYFVRVLAQVNRGRVAKQRIFAFLETEATQSEAAAKVVTEVLTRQSIAMAIGDKSKAIATLLKIHQTFPHLDIPIQVKSVAVRS